MSCMSQRNFTGEVQTGFTVLVLYHPQLGIFQATIPVKCEMSVPDKRRWPTVFRYFRAISRILLNQLIPRLDKRGCWLSQHFSREVARGRQRSWSSLR